MCASDKSHNLFKDGAIYLSNWMFYDEVFAV
jgi:hypothetical protein